MKIWKWDSDHGHDQEDVICLTCILGTAFSVVGSVAALFSLGAVLGILVGLVGWLAAVPVIVFGKWLFGFGAFVPKALALAGRISECLSSSIARGWDSESPDQTEKLLLQYIEFVKTHGPRAEPVLSFLKKHRQNQSFARAIEMHKMMIEVVLKAPNTT